MVVEAFRDFYLVVLGEEFDAVAENFFDAGGFPEAAPDDVGKFAGVGLGEVGSEGGFTDATNADDRDQAGSIGGDPLLENGGFWGSVNEDVAVWYFTPVMF